jgi:hypothetical protein
MNKEQGIINDEVNIATFHVPFSLFTIDEQQARLAGPLKRQSR